MRGYNVGMYARGLSYPMRWSADGGVAVDSAAVASAFVARLYVAPGELPGSDYGNESVDAILHSSVGRFAESRLRDVVVRAAAADRRVRVNSVTVDGLDDRLVGRVSYDVLGSAGEVAIE